MQEHGYFDIKLIGDVIHVYPVGGFNTDGIKALHNEIRTIAPTDRDWALIEHPKDGAGLTPEAADELCKNYSQLSKLGCKAIGLEINQFWARAIQRLIANKIDIPVYFHEDIQEVEKSVLKHI